MLAKQSSSFFSSADGGQLSSLEMLLVVAGSAVGLQGTKETAWPALSSPPFHLCVGLGTPQSFLLHLDLEAILFPRTASRGRAGSRSRGWTPQHRREGHHSGSVATAALTSNLL
jgi:hypothetical protein